MALSVDYTNETHTSFSGKGEENNPITRYVRAQDYERVRNHLHAFVSVFEL